MRPAAVGVLGITLLGVFFLSAAGLLHAQAGADKPAAAEPSQSLSLPKLADIIPLAGGLAGRLEVLKNDLQQMPDIPRENNDYAAIAAELDDISVRLQQVKDSHTPRLSQLVDLSQELRDDQALLENIGSPLSRKINRLAGLKAEWQAEKNKWQDWESRLLTEQDSPQLKAAFDDAGEVIDTALKLLSEQLEAAFAIQARNKTVRTKIAVLDAEIESLITTGRRDYLLTASPPMYSADYFSQFQTELWKRMLENVRTVSPPDRLYFVQHGWTFIAQLLLFVVVVFSIFRNREELRASERWHFLALRPFATGFFVVILTQLLVPENQRVPTMVFLLFAVIGGISFSRILVVLVEDSWQRRAILGVITLYVVSKVMSAIRLPLPLFRLYILLVALLAMYFLISWAIRSTRQPESALYTWGLRLGYILLGLIIFAQLQGKEGLASYLFNSTLTSLTVILAFCLFIYMIRGGLRWVFFSSPVWNIKQLRSEAEPLSRRFGYLVEALIFGFALLPILLTTWGAYGSAPKAAKQLLDVGFDIGSERVTVGFLLTAIGILYGSFILSWILPKVFLDEKVAGANLERGVRIAIGNLIQYFIILVGFILTLTALGLDFTKLTIILSALGVGIGFGLQGLVNNFISGLVLLFERPVRVGDRIEIGEKWAEIKKIGLRSTSVQTFDKADVIIPNADLISKMVTNWTLTNRQVRASIQVGVAYGSDVAKVMETLLASATDHDKVLKIQPPQVLFKCFGPSSLDFELRVWVTDVDYLLTIKSELHEEIDRRFREADIEIAFPQLDLHLRNGDNPLLHHPAGDAETSEQTAPGTA